MLRKYAPSLASKLHTPWVVRCYKHTPCKGKSFKVLVMKLLPLQGALMVAVCTQGVALG